MSHPYSMTMTRPHESLHLSMPLGKRLPRGLVAWNLCVGILIVGCAIGYIVKVNTTVAYSYQVRAAEKRVHELQSETMAMQDKLASLSSLQELTTKAEGNGYVPVEHIEYVRVPGTAFAFK